ncbi:hypothetical protein MSMEG_2689 [Mycolicibacterium smegmatis MC2 155]|uniref:Uncharacterized protein n=1 Tax=Mycolicibacterium smegmatis (strain ATCC 700084 / mc(2)155) TaxID=246196 RepID=A0QVT7_MYCS2|nr:hypothetical protein MSMEG_2689 [Mycolicibacterium smegmatis MC2 155]
MACERDGRRLGPPGGLAPLLRCGARRRFPPGAVLGALLRAAP